mgnify:CR=1 FL=1
MAKIAVLGYGTVGSGVVEVLNTNGASIAKRAGDTIEVKSVLDLRDFPGDPIQDKIVHDIDLIINDPEIEVVVEVMGGVEPAFTFVKKALEAGKSVCTSNKALVAAHGPELLEMAKERKLNFNNKVDGSTIKAKYENGVLVLELQKMQKKQAQSIVID